MLNDFFRINMPYGIARNEQGGWMAFNREYMPIGFNSTENKGNPGSSYLELPIYTQYEKLTEKILLSLADDEASVQRDKDGKICRVFLYGDGTNPRNNKNRAEEMWCRYFEKIKKLSGLSVE